MLLIETLSAVGARAESWTRLEMRWQAHPIQHNFGQPVVSVEFESSSAWFVEVMIWASGEAELATVRVDDDRIVNKHYELADPDDLERLLDELVGLLVNDRLPDAAVVARWPGNARLIGPAAQARTLGNPVASSCGRRRTVSQ
jgi:hypothetical protein